MKFRIGDIVKYRGSHRNNTKTIIGIEGVYYIATDSRPYHRRDAKWRYLYLDSAYELITRTNNFINNF